MNILVLENSLTNLSFICLFISTIFYWSRGIFFIKNKSNKMEIFILLIANFCLISLLLVRWIESNHFPLTNLYESLIFLSWAFIFFLIILELKVKESYLGILITPIALITNTYATFSLPLEMQKASALVPALQSNWLMMHVTIMMLSYSALLIGSLLSIGFLVINYLLGNSNKKTFFILIDTKNIFSTEITKNQNSNLIFSNLLDNLSFRFLSLGFPLLTIGILSGAIWANETWGSFWSWDPKETWALITWMVYAIYLHSRLIKGWKGKKPAFIASFGFFIIWVCYLGVNVMGKGLHSYGWF